MYIIFDTETTGLPKRLGNFRNFDNYKNLSSYENARLIQLSFFSQILKKLHHQMMNIFEIIL